MASALPASGRFVRFADILALAAAYLAAERLRVFFPFTEGVSWVWLPSGVALATLLLRGRDRWPGVALGAFAAALYGGEAWMAALLPALYATLEASVATSIVRRDPDFDSGLRSVGHVLRLLGAALAGAAIAATLGAPLLAPDSAATFTTTWVTFFMGDLMGILIVVPPALVWLGPAPPRIEGRPIEFGALVLASLAVGLLVFGQTQPVHVVLPIGFLSFPLMVWSAFRFGQPGVTAVMLVLAVATLVGSPRGLGPFSSATSRAEALVVAAFMSVVGITALILAALVRERERARAEHLASETRFRAFMRHSPAISFMKSASGQYVFGNEAWAAQFGATPAALIGKSDADLWPAQTARVFAESDHVVLERRVPVELTESGLGPDGAVRWWRTLKFPILQPGQPPLLAGIAIDVSQSQRVESALRESETRYRSLVDLAGSVIVVLDPDGRVAEFNREAESFFGMARAQAIGRQYLDACVPEAARAVMSADLARVRAGEAVREREVTFVAADGTRRSMVWNGSRLLDTAGRLSGVLLTGQDLSDLRRLEAQLLLSQRMEGIGRLAGGIAHDFNNLLTAILGHAEMARDDVGPGEEALGNLAEITRAAQRAADLTRQLLAFARRQIIEPRNTDLNALVLNVDRMLRRLLGEDVELVTVPSPNLWRVRIDPGQFEQVLVNLAVNARDALPDGGTLLVETRNVYLDSDFARHHATVIPGPHVMLAVTDTGTGMDGEVLSHIFEPFFTTKEVGKGTGLGLATCYGIVKQNKGSIWVYSEPGHGTTFRIYLPRADGAAPQADEQEPQQAQTDSRGSETVLLAEDEALVRNLAADALRRQGYQVLVAATGSDALELAVQSQSPIDVLVTDVVMPQMGGPELARRLLHAQPSLKVLFISGYTDNALVHQGVLQPGMTLLQKPFTPGQLTRRVRELLDADRSAPGADAPAQPPDGF